MKTTKRTLALVLALALVLSITTLPALASDAPFQTAQEFPTSNGDGYTPYALNWDDAANGLISWYAQILPGNGVIYDVRIYKNGVYVQTSATQYKNDSYKWTASIAHAMKDPAEYMFVVSAYRSSSKTYEGIHAKSTVYTVGAATPSPSPTPSQPTENPPPPSKVRDFSSSRVSDGTYFREAQIFNAPNGDNWTAYNLQWLDGATGRVSADIPRGISGAQLALFRDGIFLGEAANTGTTTNSDGSRTLTWTLSQHITTPGKYEFIVYRVEGRSSFQLYGEIAKSQPYNHGSAPPPVTMPSTIPGWSPIVASENAVMAIKSDNSLWVWGRDERGVLGSGGDKTISEPMKLIDGVAAVGMGFLNSYIIKTDGSLWVSGEYYTDMEHKQWRTFNTHFKIMDGVASASIDGKDIFAVKTDGSLWHWRGTYVNNTAQNIYKVMDGVISVTAVTYGSTRGLVIRTDGSLMTLNWGNPVVVGTKLMDGVASLARYEGRNYAVKTDGSLWGWGNNGNLDSSFSILGNGSTTEPTAPTKIMDGVAVVAPSQEHVILVKTDGSVWGWGTNRWDSAPSTYGPLGPSSVGNTNTPVKIMDSGFVYAAAGKYDTLAVKSDGSLMAWGFNASGMGNHGEPAQVMTSMKLTPSGTTAPPPANPLDSASGWAKAGITAALAKGFVPNDIQGSYTNVINRAEFCRMAVKWLEYKLGKGIDAIVAEKGIAARASHTFSDTTDPAILAAYRLGVTAGSVAPTATSPGQFNPSGQFTRLEAAMMIMNACGVAGMDVANAPRANFADMNQAASWAHPGINFVHANGIMSGDGTNFLPVQTYSREQSILTFNNVE